VLRELVALMDPIAPMAAWPLAGSKVAAVTALETRLSTCVAAFVAAVPLSAEIACATVDSMPLTADEDCELTSVNELTNMPRRDCAPAAFSATVVWAELSNAPMFAAAASACDGSVIDAADPISWFVASVRFDGGAIVKDCVALAAKKLLMKSVAVKVIDVELTTSGAAAE
jgi:hypothetical protein